MKKSSNYLGFKKLSNFTHQSINMAFLKEYYDKSISRQNSPEFKKEMMLFKVSGLPIASMYHMYKRSLIKTLPKFMDGFLGKKLQSAHENELNYLSKTQSKLYPKLIKSYANDDDEILKKLHEHGFTDKPHNIKAINFDVDILSKAHYSTGFVNNNSIISPNSNNTIYLYYDCLGGVKNPFTNHLDSEQVKIYTRFFILCHEAAHPEINRFKNQKFSFDLFSDDFNKKINENFFTNFPSIEKIKRTHDETFADTYGAMMFLHGFDFSPTSLNIVKRNVIARQLLHENNKRYFKKKNIPFFDIYQFCSQGLNEVFLNASAIKNMSPNECLDYARDIASRNTLKIFKNKDMQSNILKSENIYDSLKAFARSGVLLGLRDKSGKKEQSFLSDFYLLSTTHQRGLYESFYKKFKNAKSLKITTEQLSRESKHLFTPDDIKGQINFNREIDQDANFLIRELEKDTYHKSLVRDFKFHQQEVLTNISNQLIAEEENVFMPRSFNEESDDELRVNSLSPTRIKEQKSTPASPFHHSKSRW